MTRRQNIPVGQQIVRRVVLAAAVILAALGVSTGAAFAAELPKQWDPSKVAVNHDPSNTFLLRPGQVLVGPGDAADVQRVLKDYKAAEQRPFGLTLLITKPRTTDPAREVLDALARVRKATAGRPEGPAQVAPNYVFVGEAAGDAINFHGEPRIQGGPGSTVRPATLPATLPQRGALSTDGAGAKIAVLDTGLFDHEWLRTVQRAPGSADTWDADADGYGDAEAGHGTFIAGLIRQVAPAADIYAVKVLDSHGVGDDFGVAAAMAQLPTDTDVVNLSLGGYTDRDQPPLAILNAMRQMGGKRAVVAAAGNHASSRPFWPAAFGPVLSVGAVEGGETKWARASYSNHGKWVDATARGTNLQSTFTRAKTLLALGSAPSPADPTIAFDGWARWDGTSFATPIAAAMIARTMSRAGLASGAEAEYKLVASAPPVPVSEFPRAVLLDELEGKAEPKS
ncbi:S8/S53 family peptidase [Solirubrobacter phytolaccae]|uniref:S8/S53 family peptidase n=1 Tax=Solirubrobacter phytolaccae TaxID=1404360 RepID=A0A9X3NEV9_9ACTN|nr:S8/S53 family peptidase [Solirubrobacter phytolaccae]MDA0183697.1 S8/S53 family peptidase [Solirubrobacter phytolaccae]